MTDKVPPDKTSAAPDPPKAKAAKVELTAAQKEQVDRLQQALPDYKPLVGAEAAALGVEALEGYFYGERTRYDSSGKQWLFRRDHENNQFRLTIRCSTLGVVLAETAYPLDRVASLDGEKQLLAVVEALSEQAVAVAQAARAYQKAAEPEAAETASS